MNLEAVMIAINILQTIHSFHYEADLIHQLNEFYGFDHNIFLFDTSFIHHHYIPTVDVDSSMHYTSQTVFTFNEMTSPEILYDEIKSKNPFLIIVVDSFKFGRNGSKILALIAKIRDVKVNIKVGVFIRNNVPSMNDINKLFLLSWRVKLLNIFCAFYRNNERDANSAPRLNVFKFDPFDRFKVTKMAGIVSPSSYFHDVMKPNYRGYPMRLIEVNEVTNSLIQIHFWSSVVAKFNATEFVVNLDSTSAFGMLKDDNDILPYENFVDGKVYMYPHRTVTILMIVPHAKPYSDFMAFLKALTSESTLGYTLAMILLVSLVLTVAGYLQKNEIAPIDRLVDVLNILMNDNGAIKYRQLSASGACIIVPLTFVGLIVMNGVLSVFESYATSPRYQHQINTLAGLYNSQIPIIINKIVWAEKVIEVLERLTHFGGWSDKIHPMSLLQSVKELNSMNNSIAFPLYDEQANVLLQVQKGLDLKVYHLLTDTDISKHIMACAVPKNFVYIDYLNDLLLRWQSAGLYDRWFQFVFEKRVSYGVRLILRGQAKVTVESESFTVITFFWVWCGWIASVMIFITEIVWNKCQQRKINQTLRGKFDD